MRVDPVGEVVFGEGEQGAEQGGFEDLVAVGNEGVGVAFGAEVVAGGLALLAFGGPVAQVDGCAEGFGGLSGGLPVADGAVPGEAADENVPRECGGFLFRRGRR